MLADGTYMVCSSEYFDGLVTETKYNRGGRMEKAYIFLKQEKKQKIFLYKH